jgi:hypothetical protein
VFYCKIFPLVVGVVADGVETALDTVGKLVAPAKAVEVALSLSEELAPVLTVLTEVLLLVVLAEVDVLAGVDKDVEAWVDATLVVETVTVVDEIRVDVVAVVTS